MIDLVVYQWARAAVRYTGVRLNKIGQSWNELGVVDPLFGVLSDPGKLGGHWDLSAFYETGQIEICQVLTLLQSLNIPLRHDCALDFGCAVGRLSAALAEHFGTVTALDIAPSMLDRGSALVQKSNIRWTLNKRADLNIIPTDSMDFVYSSMVLQHMPRKFALRYIAEFIRVAKPRGVVVFQLPDAAPYSWKRRMENFIIALMPYVPKTLIDAYRKVKYRNADAETIKRLPHKLMEMHGASPKAVRHLLENAGASVVAITSAPVAGPGWESYQYVAVKR